jgi:hypothetical protein
MTLTARHEFILDAAVTGTGAAVLILENGQSETDGDNEEDGGGKAVLFPSPKALMGGAYSLLEPPAALHNGRGSNVTKV